MKRCPTCHARYAADSTYCATDGTPLVADAPLPPPYPGVPMMVMPAPAPSRGIPPLAVVGLVAGILVVGALLWLFVQQNQRAAAMEETVRLADARAADAVRAAADAERAAQEARLTDAEARLANADARAVESAATPQPVGTSGAFSSVAWANSPGDGFLALRSHPSTSTGRRLARIPHGAQIALGACNPASQVPGGRVGQWCRTRWGGMEGWAFTAYMSF